MQQDDAPIEMPTPGLEPRKITMDEYHALTPEKLELWEGCLILPREYPEERRNLLLLLLVNEGLVEAVRLAPAEHWRSALRQVYGEA